MHTACSTSLCAMKWCWIDVNKKRAEGEAMDLITALLSPMPAMTIYAGEYGDCSDADMW